MRVLLDTNAILEHLASGSLENTSDEIRFAISVITITELFQLAGIGKEETEAIHSFLRLTECFPIDYRVALRAAELGRTRGLGLPDRFIAATALEYNVPLITNDKAFRRIPKLIVRSRP